MLCEISASAMSSLDHNDAEQEDQQDQQEITDRPIISSITRSSLTDRSALACVRSMLPWQPATTKCSSWHPAPLDLHTSDHILSSSHNHSDDDDLIRALRHHTGSLWGVVGNCSHLEQETTLATWVDRHP